MQIKSVFTDDEAVSPVIGVILMVAITVILAAVIGAFVLGIGGSQSQPPQASWEWQNESSTGVDCTDDTGDTNVQVTHQGGDEITSDNLVMNGGDCATGNSITAGSSLYTDADHGDTVTLVWEDPSSDSTSILSEFEI